MNKKAKNTLSACTVASVLITSSLASVNVKAASVTPPESPRLWGADRYETAVKVSQAGWTSASDYAIIASGEGYADALCAAPLAKANNAPILLASKDTISQSTLAELKRLNVKHVYIIGGQGSISEAVENKIKSEITSDIQRLGGQNRYETSVKVAEKVGVLTKVVLASGEGFADALSAAPVAAIEGMPILLTESKTLSKPVADYIKANSGITKTYVIGGIASVSESTMGSVPGAERFGGADRFETNAKVIKGFSADFDFKNVYVALGHGPNGNEFADALTGSALAAKNKSPLIITGKELDSSIEELLKSKLTASSTITVLGGTANVSDTLLSDMKEALPKSTSNGGGGGSSSSSTTYLSKDGYTYSNDISQNADITGDNVTLTGDVSGDLTIHGDNATISNITVSGTIYVDPGSDGEVTLNNVTAKNIVVLSGAPNTVTLNGTKADKLTVNSSCNVRIKSLGNTDIKSTEIKSQVILQSDSGSFGTIKVIETPSGIKVQLKGIFDRPIMIQGDIELVIPEGDSANIPAIIIEEGVSASGIKIQGQATIGNIQIKSKDAGLIITGNVVVTGTIEAVEDTTVDTTGNATHPDVTEKPVDDMEDVTTYTDITSEISKVYVDNIADYIANHPGLSKYFTVSASTSALTIQLNNGNLNSLSDAFDRTKAQDIETIKANLSKAQKMIDLHSSYIKVDGVSYKEFLGKLNSQYINTDGSLNIEKIAARIDDETLTYDEFKAHVKSRIEAVYTGSSVPELSVSYKGISETVTAINKDGAVIYNSALTRAANIENLVNLGDATTGTYTVYCGTDYFTVKVLPAK